MTTPNNDLKVCPFCGSQPKCEGNIGHNHIVEIRCENLDCFLNATWIGSVNAATHGYSHTFGGNGHKILELWNTRSALLTPSDPDTAKALEIVSKQSSELTQTITGENCTVLAPCEVETIRTCILSLSAQVNESNNELGWSNNTVMELNEKLAEKERELEECHDELESNSHSISELTKVIENYQKKGAAQ